MQIQRKDGSFLDVSLSVSAVRDENGNILNSRSVLRDITDRKQAEEVLKRVNEIVVRSGAIFFRWKNLSNFPLEFVAGNTEELCGYTPDDFSSGKADWVKMTHPEDNARLRKELEINQKQERLSFPMEYRILSRTGQTIWIQDNTLGMTNDKGEITHYESIIVDISYRKLAEIEREKLIFELQEALEKVKTLKGMVPICSHCKKIRDDKGFWNQLESYISRHSEAKFSHGICPECMTKFYEDFDDEE